MLKEKETPLQTTWGDSYNIVIKKECVGEVAIVEMNDCILVFRLEIYEQFRKKGYATKLFNFLIKKYKKNIRLAVSKENIQANNLYKKLNFKIIFTPSHKSWDWLELKIN